MPPYHHCHCSSSSSSSCCCCCGGGGGSSSPPSPSPDQLLQTLVNNQVLFPNPYPPSSPFQLNLLQTLLSSQVLSQPHAPKPQCQRHQKDPYSQGQSQTQSLLLSLLRRVAALESQLPNLSPPPPPQPVSPAAALRSRPASAAARRPSKLSVRDAAARTIQTRFRDFLVRRSRTLRQLKHLASVKSHAATMRASLSGKNRVDDPKRIAHEAMDLLLQLDSIQSSDPMIREGKRSISKELNRIVEFIDKISPKNHHIPTKEDGSRSQRQRALAPASAKRVGFARFREETNPSLDAQEPFVDEFIDLGEHVERLSNGIEGIDMNSRVSEDDDDDDEVVEEEEEEAEDWVRHGMSGKFQGQNGKLGLYAPIPVQMESRRS